MSASFFFYGEGAVDLKREETSLLELSSGQGEWFLEREDLEPPACCHIILVGSCTQTLYGEAEKALRQLQWKREKEAEIYPVRTIQ